MTRSTEFNDQFSNVSAAYAQHRPAYPEPLFELVSKHAPAHDRAWDCGTGSGLAAVGLSPHFLEVVATDASPQQLEHAARRANIKYRVALADASGIESASVNAVTVALALHWFNDIPGFYAEVHRVCTPGAVVAVWYWNGAELTFSAAIDEIIQRLARDLLADYSLRQDTLAKRFYADVAFPFTELPPPSFELAVRWVLSDLLGAIRTGASAQRCVAMGGVARLEAFFEEITKAWGDPDVVREGTTPLLVRMGRVDQ